MQQPIKLSANTNQSSYAAMEAVTVTIYARRNGDPAPSEQISLAVFRPTGTRTYRTKVHTDKNGICHTVFHLDARDITGSYSVEARASDGSLALTSFLVI
ncbi:MG2 domain-containing protein [Dethiobacter alkaliphilus]|uniref:Macroglobulin domain-containing protein n=1 Tax=Dethiobacter alkaliphilus AHT 1 TaxID=555088 RepID=C0GIW6_DETAL|nr:MG2 domain-containing protein [Dethiobacter alkaliphilus]EEG76780.1 hypothetical protein DealDRAFT_2425 [Dethiobacter alkaliphilus AHT 1]